MKVTLYFGSFNPIHLGHLIIANHVLEHTETEQVWLVVTPQNPFKDKKSLLADHHRINMVKIAIDDNSKLRASDIEFKLPTPNYTINTLALLKEQYPAIQFSLIIGGDNLNGFKKWYNYEKILENHLIYVYPRGGESFNSDAQSLMKNSRIVILENNPNLVLSSSFIRAQIQSKKSIKYLVPTEVEKYIEEMQFYKK
jgi:nicotinate-nucleotide adenylyltransferase